MLEGKDGQAKGGWEAPVSTPAKVARDKESDPL